MSKWKYIQFRGISLSTEGLLKRVGFELENPKFIYFWEGDILILFFYPPYDNEESIAEKIVFVRDEIKRYFPSYDFTIQDYLDFSAYPLADLKNRHRWDKYYEQFLVYKFLQTLLEDKWELMNREGLWFKKAY